MWYLASSRFECLKSYMTLTSPHSLCCRFNLPRGSKSIGKIFQSSLAFKPFRIITYLCRKYRPSPRVSIFQENLPSEIAYYGYIIWATILRVVVSPNTQLTQKTDTRSPNQHIYCKTAIVYTVEVIKYTLFTLHYCKVNQGPWFRAIIQRPAILSPSKYRSRRSGRCPLILTS